MCLLLLLFLAATLSWRFYAFRWLEDELTGQLTEYQSPLQGLKIDQINNLAKIIKIRAQNYELIKAARPRMTDPAR